jgi:hypothetical protein
MEDSSIAHLPSGLGVSPAELSSRPKITPVEDSEMAEMSRGTSLLLASRERVLSLSEQRVRLPIILTSSRLNKPFSGPQAPIVQAGKPACCDVGRYTTHRIEEPVDRHPSLD